MAIAPTVDYYELDGGHTVPAEAIRRALALM
jgi:hypothetical protein